MILDATAGNRTMWITKNLENIIYIDIEKQLEIKPTIFADNTKTPFLAETFSTIFYDPPHGWGEGHPFYKYPDAKSFKAVWKGYGDIPRYYGWDKCKSREQLIKHLYDAQKEFRRLLKNNGLLWIKWNVMNIRLHTILVIFNEWDVLLTLPLAKEKHTAGTHQTYWLCLTKKIEKTRQGELTEPALNSSSPQPVLS